MMNHLWQSTAFAALAWILTLALRKNRAALRHNLWFAASCKFLIPLSMLIALGSRIDTRPIPAAPPRVTLVLDQVTRPFPAVAVQNPGPVESAGRLPAILATIWLGGFAASTFIWIRQWRRARAMVRQATPYGRVDGVRVVWSKSRIEPGVFGIFRPVLLLPEGIEDRLTAAQIRAILAHEMAHVRRRDNLTAAVHMLVESIFWFHPAVWLIRWKLAEERERACDECVLQEVERPEVYAEGILNVCRFYLESRLACVAGVSGANLKKRIEAIMTDRGASRLNFARQCLLAAASLGAVAGPVVIGYLNAPAVRAQSEAFDVASVKVNKSGEDRRGLNFEPGRFRATNLPLVTLIAIAYDLPLMNSSRITGFPEWANEEAFDVEGKTSMPGVSSKAREARMKRMLQTLLAERFQLKLRRETREMPVYTLSVGKNGAKLKPAGIEEKDCPEGPVNSSSCHIINGGMGRGMHATAVDMADIALFGSYWTDRPLIDRTGLKGLYQLDTEGWVDMRGRMPRPDGQKTAEDIAGADPARPTLAMVFERLGLKMESKRGPVEIFHVEHAERPSPN